MLTPLQAHELDRVSDPAGDLVTRPACLAQAEGDVLPHVEVREQRVALEHRVDRPPVGPDSRDVPTADVDRSLGRLLEAGDHPQRRRLAAARRADDREELAPVDLEVEGSDRLQVPEPLGDGGKADRRALAGHPWYSPSSRLRRLDRFPRPTRPAPASTPTAPLISATVRTITNTPTALISGVIRNRIMPSRTIGNGDCAVP